jgi:hypothetical protein
MLHFETDKDGDQVFVHMDLEGLKLLKEKLELLEQRPDRPEHDHLLSEGWGGNELDTSLDPNKRDTDQKGNIAVDHVKLYYWPK